LATAVTANEPKEGEVEDNTQVYFAISIAILAAIVAYFELTKKDPADEVEQFTLSSVVQPGDGVNDELDPEDRLCKELDAHSYEKDMSGMLSKDGFLTMRNVITAVTQEEFKSQKEELME
jgi:hypothetical protein